MTRYAVTFTKTPTQPVMVCDKDTIFDALGRLSGDQVEDIFMHILDWRIRNGDREDMEDLLYHVFFNFVNTASIEDIKKELISDEIKWMLDRMDHSPGLAKGFTHWGIQVEVIE